LFFIVDKISLRLCLFATPRYVFSLLYSPKPKNGALDGAGDVDALRQGQVSSFDAAVFAPKFFRLFF